VKWENKKYDLLLLVKFTLKVLSVLMFIPMLMMSGIVIWGLVNAINEIYDKYFVRWLVVLFVFLLFFITYKLLDKHLVPDEEELDINERKRNGISIKRWWHW
jgi:amino acid permease